MSGEGVTVEEVGPDAAANIAASEIRAALEELDRLPASHDATHVRMHLESALVWLDADGTRSTLSDDCGVCPWYVANPNCEVHGND